MLDNSQQDQLNNNQTDDANGINQANQADNFQNSDPNYQYYDEYYGGTSMQYNADQIAQYEQNYDQYYANQYYDYYQQYYTNPNVNDKEKHRQEYAYYLQNYDYMKQNFPKKRKIIRWEELDRNYNSLDQTNDFIEMLEQYQQSNDDNNQNQDQNY